MEASRKYKLNLGNPFFNCFRLRLTLLIILFEIIREIAIQIEAPCIISEKYGLEELYIITFMYNVLIY